MSQQNNSKNQPADSSLFTFYIDGSFYEGRAGWACLNDSDGTVLSEAGALPTSYSAELEALILALRQDFHKAVIYTDCLPLREGFELRVTNYVQNKRLGSLSHSSDKLRWKLVRKLLNARDVRLEWVKGHSGNRGNDIADRVARSARARWASPVRAKRRIRALLKE